MKIFVCIESYLPGTKGGGPVRALANLIEQLGETHAFYVLTRNRDYLTDVSYRDVAVDTWTKVGQASVFYASDADFARVIQQQVQAVQPDWIYLNGAFAPLSRMYLMVCRRLKKLQAIPVLLAPHGNLSEAAMGHHAWRKQAWLGYAKWRGLFRGVIWHAASEREADQVRQVLGPSAQVRIVPMAPRPARPPAPSSVLRDPSISLRLVYFGRLSPEKNLPFAFEVLRRCAERHPDWAISYDLIGAGGPNYEQELRRLAGELPSSVQVNFIGQLDPDVLTQRLNSISASPSDFTAPSSALRSSSSVLRHSSFSSPSSSYHALLMPSLTENFSYTVLESFQAGIPVLISDQTPWRGLEAKGIGWDLPLHVPEDWDAAMDSLVAMTPEGRISRSKRAREFADEWEQGYQQQAERLFALSASEYSIVSALR